VEIRNGQSCCHGQRKLPGLEDRQSCCHEQRKLPNRQSCCHGQRKLPSLEEGQSCCHEQRKLPDMERVDDCCAAQRGSILSGDGMSSLVPAVSVNLENADRIAYYESPVKSTAETGYEVNQSDSYCPNSYIAVFPCPHPALDQGEVCLEGKALNDTESSIIQHDSTDCEQFEGAVGMGLSTPSSYDEVNIFSDGCLEQCADFPKGKKFCTLTLCQLSCHRVEFSLMTHLEGRHV